MVLLSLVTGCGFMAVIHRITVKDVPGNFSGVVSTLLFENGVFLYF